MDRRSKAIDEHLKKLDLEVTDLGTSFKVVTGRLENKLESTYQTLQVLASRQEKIEDAVLDLNKKYEKVVAFMAQISTDLRTNQKNKGMEESMGDLKFGSETYAPGEEVVEIYNKSKQLGSIEEYQEKFEELKSQVLESMKTGSRGKGTVRKETKEALKPVDYRKLGKRKAVVEADKKPAMKRKAAKKDPNKPKRPPSAFFVFLEEFRKTFKKENPDVKGVAAVGKAGGEKWKSMSAAEKAPYEAKAAKKKAEYGSLVDGYNKKQESSADEGGKESERSKSEVHDEDDESVQEEEDDDGEEEDEEEEDDDDD